MLFQNNDRCSRRALPHCRDITVVAWIIVEVEAIRVWSYQPTLHLGFPEGKAITLRYPPQRLPCLGNHETRTLPQKRLDICLSQILNATCIQRTVGVPEFCEWRLCDDPLGRIHALFTLCTVDRAGQTNWRKYYVTILGKVVGYASLTTLRWSWRRKACYPAS